MNFRIFVCAVLLCSAAAFSAEKPLPVVLDTDMGDDIDDALALGLALNSPELKVLAVNTVLQQGQRRADLTYRILELYGRTDIPVGVGAETTLLGKAGNAVVKQAEALAPEYHMPANRR